MDNKLTKSDIKKILKMTFKYDPDTVNTYLQNPQNADEEYRNTLIKLNMKKNPLEFIDKVYDTYNVHTEGGYAGATRGAIGMGTDYAKRFGRAATIDSAKRQKLEDHLKCLNNYFEGQELPPSQKKDPLQERLKNYVDNKINSFSTPYKNDPIYEYDSNLENFYQEVINAYFKIPGKDIPESGKALIAENCRSGAMKSFGRKVGSVRKRIANAGLSAVSAAGTIPAAALGLGFDFGVGSTDQTFGRLGRGAAAALGVATPGNCAKCPQNWCKNEVRSKTLSGVRKGMNPFKANFLAGYDGKRYPNYPEQYQENPNQEDLQEHPDYQQGYYDALNEYPAGEEQYEEYPAGQEQMQQMPMRSPYVYPINYQQQYYE